MPCYCCKQHEQQKALSSLLVFLPWIPNAKVSEETAAKCKEVVKCWPAEKEVKGAEEDEE
jgi:hypothetical protein